MKQFMAVVTAALSAQQSLAATDKCYALAFGAGEETSAYQAGVLKGLIAANGPDAHAYSAITGISGTAVNAAILSSYPVGSEAEAADRIVQFWQNASASPLYKDWIGGVFEGLAVKKGLYNNKGLKDFLASELTDIGDMQRFVDVGLTDALSGFYVDNFADDLDANLQDILFASFAYAGLFAPAESMGTEWFDGAVVWHMDIFTAVNKCLTTHAPEDIVLDVIMSQAKTIEKVDAHDYNVIELYFRYRHLTHYWAAMDGLLRAQKAYPDIQWRYVVMPSETLPKNRFPLNYSTDEINDMVSLGQNDAFRAVGEYQNGGDLEDTLTFFSMQKKKDKRVRGVSYDKFREMKRSGVFSDFDQKVNPTTYLQ